MKRMPTGAPYVYLSAPGISRQDAVVWIILSLIATI